MMDKISVIIPFFKGKEWLKEAIDSVLNQTINPHEIIIVNDGSPENIDDLIAEYDTEAIFIHQENKGPASARNTGIKSSTGDYIAFLDADDLWHNNKLEIQLKYMQRNNLCWSHGPYEVFEDETYKTLKVVNNLDVEGMIFPRSLARCSIATPCVMVRKDCLNDDRMLFNEEMRQGQDYCFWNVLAKKYEVGNVGVPLALVRHHRTNIAKSVIFQLKSKSMMYDYLKSNTLYFGRINKLLLSAFLLTKKSYHLINKIDSIRVKTICAYMLYAIPWITFRLYYLFSKHNSGS